MSSSNKDEEFNFLLSFSDDVGEIEEDAFVENLPEGITPETFDLVDSYRDEFVAHAVGQMIDYGKEYFEENSDAVLTIAEYSLGGNTVFDASLSPDGTVVTAITANGNSALEDIMKKSLEIFKEDN